MQQLTPPEAFDLAGMVADLNSLLRLKTTVIGIKMFARVEEMTAIPKIRRPSAVQYRGRSTPSALRQAQPSSDHHSRRRYPPESIQPA